MLKSATAVLTALTAGWVLFGSPTSASAGQCEACGPRPPIFHKHVVYKNIEVWRHHNRLVIRPVPRPQPIISVTEVQPIKHVHDVYHVTIQSVPGPVYPVYRHYTRFLPEQIVHSSNTVYRYVGCGCGHRPY
jgi:hypothetical protein